jgi:hypothetical protein
LKLSLRPRQSRAQLLHPPTFVEQIDRPKLIKNVAPETLVQGRDRTVQLMVPAGLAATGCRKDDRAGAERALAQWLNRKHLEQATQGKTAVRNRDQPQAYGTALAGQEAPPIDRVRDSDLPRPSDHRPCRSVSGPRCRIATRPSANFPRADSRSATGDPAMSPEPIGRARVIRHRGSYITSRSSSPMT